ncbi:MAG: hypothetical protein K0Q87_188 [Neobacillus sp.]|nr:hypothetical protein [Neobacillus sp.]
MVVVDNRDRQAVLDVMNSLPVIETNGGEDAYYILVANNEENREKLNAVGVAKRKLTMPVMMKRSASWPWLLTVIMLMIMICEKDSFSGIPE